MLELAGIVAGYGRLVVLREVSLEVPAGQVAAVIGANGAGKTTLLRVISGLVVPQAGCVRLAGQDITGWPAEQVVAAGVVHVPERRQLFGSMRVEDNLLLGAYLRLRGEGWRAVQQDLERVYDLFPRLRERHRQVAATLSGGEQQMLAIGRALLARPRVLLLDEPSLGLAPLLVRELYRVIGHLREQGYTVLLVEQNAHQALRVADVAYVMETGTITLRGAGAELLRRPEVQAAYLGAV
ncbi:MAG: ABC transporter ATP-binding protein [candidate division GAL15 bacterium]